MSMATVFTDSTSKLLPSTFGTNLILWFAILTKFINIADNNISMLGSSMKFTLPSANLGKR